VGCLGLAALLLGLFPANVYAAMADVRLGGDPVTPLWIRTPLQLFWIALLTREESAATTLAHRPQQMQAV
jgi:uncharacterized membrane protein